MRKTGKWLRSFLTGKKEKEKSTSSNHNSSSVATENPTTPTLILPTTPREKRRWSFRRSSATAAAPKDLNSAESISISKLEIQAAGDHEDEQKKHAMAVAAATAAAAQAAAVVIQLTAAATGRASAIEEAAATKIQSVFRGYLARKALCALKGLVKLQALVRGHLVRKQATATLRCMQALVTVQARARAQRLRMTDQDTKPSIPRQSIHRKSTQENRFRHQNISDRGMEENVRIVEMDLGESKGSLKSRNSSYSKQDDYYQVSPAPSAMTDMSPRAYSGHFEDYSLGTAQSSPQYYSAVSKQDPSRVPFAFPRPDYEEAMSYGYDCPLFPNYMANTESSRAKARSQSAPKSRPDSYERQPSRKKVSMEGRNIPRAMRMQRSSSHVGATAQNYQYPWSIKLDRSTVSLKESECGSTSTVLTNTNYCRSAISYDPQGNRY